MTKTVACYLGEANLTAYHQLMHFSSIGEAPLDTPATLVAVANPAPRRRLAELGLRPGAVVTVLRRTAGHGRIVAVAGSRIALDAATARLLSLRWGEVA